MVYVLLILGGMVVEAKTGFAAKAGSFIKAKVNSLRGR